MEKYRDLYSVDFSAFQLFCREDLQNKVKEQGATREAFEDDYVSLKTNAGIYKVKYTGQCRFTRPRQVASRGTTWFRDGSWYFTMPKFPNGSQSLDFFGVDEQTVVKDLFNQGYKLEYMPKWDGSAIHLFRHDGETHAYTLGCLNREMKMQGAIPDSPTFSDLAIELFQTQYPEGETWLDANPGCGLVFEMCSRWNLIVTQYENLGERGRLYPLIVVESGGDLSWRFPPEMLKDHITWHVPTLSELTEVEAVSASVSGEKTMAGVGNIDSLSDFKEKLFRDLVDDPCFGTNPEGLVSYAVKRDKTGVATVVHPLFKHKRPEYLIDHRKVVLQPGSANDLNHVCEAVLQETYDDWIHPSVDTKKLRDQYRDKLETYMNMIISQLRSVSVSDSNQNHDPQPENLRRSHLVQMDQFQGKQHRGSFARYINTLKLPKWIMSGLFQMHTNGESFEECGEEDLIRKVLLSVPGEPSVDNGVPGTTRLAALQRSSGPYWFDPSLLSRGGKETSKYGDYVPRPITSSWTKERGLAVFDWDHTMAPCRDGQRTEYYEDPDTVEAPFAFMVEMMYSYLQAQWRVVVVTGRLYRVEPAIRKHLESDGRLSEVEIFCCPPKGEVKADSHEFKLHTVTTLAQGMHTVVHFDDDSRVLHSLVSTPLEDVRYVPYLANNGGVSALIQGHRPIVLLKIGPPGDGKTSVTRELEVLLERQGRTFTSTGFDKIQLEYLKTHGKRPDKNELSCEDMYEIVMGSIRKNLLPNNVVFVDMCHDGNSIIKRLRQMHTRGQVFLFMFSTMAIDHISVKNTSGKSRMEYQANESYLARLVHRVHVRIDNDEARGDGHSSTLTDHSRVEKIVRQKAEGCVRNVTNPSLGVLQLLNDLSSPSEVAAEVMKHINEALQQTVATHSYLAIPIDRKLLPPTPAGFEPVVLPHVTMAYGDGDAVKDRSVGEKFRVDLYQTVCDDRAVAVVVTVDPPVDGYGDHITVGVASGTPPFYAKSLVKAPVGLSPNVTLNLVSVPM